MATALLVVDAQVNMWDAPLHDGPAVLERLVALVARARAAGAAVVFVRNIGGPDDPDAIDAPGVAIHPRLVPLAGERVVDKRAPSAFEGTPLERELRDARISRVIVAGMQTEICIDATCRAARRTGFDVILARGAHATFDGRRTAAAIIGEIERSLEGTVEVRAWDSIDF
jgi:nicotinamidase-related amidase